MRALRLLIALACLGLGVAVGALNHQPVSLDLGYTILSVSLGIAVLGALLLGVLIGGLVLTASVVLPLRQRLRRLQSGRVAAAPPPEGP